MMSEEMHKEFREINDAQMLLLEIDLERVIKMSFN